MISMIDTMHNNQPLTCEHCKIDWMQWVQQVQQIVMALISNDNQNDQLQPIKIRYKK